MDTKLTKKADLFLLTMAQDSVTIARYANNQIIQTQMSVENEGHKVLLYAVITTYGRAFQAMQPFGKLAKEWGQFDNKRLTETHRLLMDLRNQYVAHADYKGREVVVYPRKALKEKFGLELSGLTFTISPRTDGLGYPAEDIEQLCGNLLESIKAIHLKITKELFGDGTSLTEAFPLITDDDYSNLMARWRKNRTDGMWLCQRV